MVALFDITELVQCQLASVSDKELADCIRRHLVPPYIIMGHWQYGTPGQVYPCWVVLEDRHTDTAVVFCEEGFAPDYPWGIMTLADRNMGMDCCWHVSLEHAVRNCSLWTGKNPPDYEIP